MAFHLIPTLFHLGETVVGVATNNSDQVTGGLVKTVASLVPGGSIVASAALKGGEHTVNFVENHAHNALHVIDDMGNGDGVADLGDIAEGVHHFFGSIFG